MTVYVVERNPRDPRNYAIFWDSENHLKPDGSVNFQTREYPVGYVPAIPLGAVWPPSAGSIWPGAVPAEYIEQGAAAPAISAPEPAKPEPMALVGDPFLLPDEELEMLTQ
jgi:hypothetical protein